MQRCKTSNMTVSYENMNLQIPSMFDAEPTSAELISSRKRWLSDLVINETPKLYEHSRNTPNNTHYCPARKRRHFPSKEGCQNTQKGDSRKKKQPSSLLSSPIPPHTLTEQTDFAGHQEEPCEEVPRNVVRNLFEKRFYESRRRRKLQSLRLHINSKTKGPACNYFVPDGMRCFQRTHCSSASGPE